MRNVQRLLNITITVSCLVLATSYFLPVAASWSPVDAWRGYYSGRVFVGGFNIGLIELFPFGTGVVILFALAVSRRPKVGIATIVAFSAAWLVSLVCEVIRMVRDAAVKFTELWLILALLIIPAMVIVILLCLRKFREMVALLTFTAIVAFAAILQQVVSIVWYIAEDGLLLNIGSITGMAAATTLFANLLVKRQICLNESVPGKK